VTGVSGPRGGESYNYPSLAPKGVQVVTEPGAGDAPVDVRVEAEEAMADGARAASEPSAEPERAGPEGAPPEGCEDLLKRAMADLENMRRQAERTVAMRVASAVGPVMADLVNIRDDLARARDAASGADAEGLDGILRNADALLARNGVSEIDSLGMPFDPLRHETVSVVDDPVLEDGTVTSVLRKGYIYNDRVLRPSLVAISRRTGGQDG